MELTLPLSLTTLELHSFNRFWKGLSPGEREYFDQLIRTVIQNQPSARNGTAYLTYDAFLLALLVEEHKEVQRLRRVVGDQQGQPAE